MQFGSANIWSECIYSYHKITFVTCQELAIHIQNMKIYMKIFDNPGIFGNASTILAASISAVNAGSVVKVPENAEISGIAEDLPKLPGLSKIFIFWLILEWA